jgi:ElaB/YqjD/DUF883 family membrane-anchored ribosome-binding protein
MTDKNKKTEEQIKAKIEKVLKEVKESKMQQNKRLYEQAKRYRKACGKFEE